MASRFPISVSSTFSDILCSLSLFLTATEIPWERSDTVGAAAAVCRRATETRTSDKNPFMIAGCHGEVIVEVSLGCWVHFDLGNAAVMLLQARLSDSLTRAFPFRALFRFVA
ncbi:hypothetical protein BDR03DRAFT_969888 [Suillus americanus]|nr:hypothetical protein BDR03DRAFT_969888 [Suillus americanus]